MISTQMGLNIPQNPIVTSKNPKLVQRDGLTVTNSIIWLQLLYHQV